MVVGPRDAEAMSKITDSLLASLRHVATVSAGAIAFLTVFASNLTDGGPPTALVVAALFLLGALALSLLTHVLFALAYVSLADPGESYVKDNKGAFVCLVIALALFAGGFVSLFFVLSDVAA